MSFDPYHAATARAVIPGHLPPESSTAKEPKRKVSFRPTVTVYPIKKLACNREDKSRLYLSKEEMKEITIKIRAVQSSFKEAEDYNELYPCAERCKSGLQADPVRGLELALCSTRVRHRFIIIRTILKYHRKLIADPTKSDEEKLSSLATVSSKLSQWSVLVAVEAAKNDLLQA
ncbi:hypothetical protein ACHAXA_003183 [Cyclostephanos tholiformis]|uniref:Uncharacterized protein n=1 Tax=Cyclostephanos tholiformis TaxID=382380 RepID=A0ABD3SS46_9STRA